MAKKKTSGRRASTPTPRHIDTPKHGGRAVFVDRDGTLNEMVYDENHGIMDSPRRPEQLRLRKGAAELLKGLRKAGYRVVIVTNQPGVAKGTLTVKELDALNRRLADLLRAEGAGWDDLRFCPHHPKGEGKYRAECACRKPKPGMLTDAARDLGIDLPHSWMVGDGLTDVQAGRAAGCRTILVTKLKVEQVERFFDLRDCEPDAIAEDLEEALRLILKNKAGGSHG